MIQMVDNDKKNTFIFLCEICGKSVTDKTGECLFLDDVPNKPVFTHFDKCSNIYEEFNDYNCGNMHIREFIQYLMEAANA